MDFSFVRQSNADDSYDFHLNDAAVYSSRATNGATWVFGVERLDRLTFQSLGDEGLARLSLEPDTSDVWSGALRLQWGRKIGLSEGPAFRLAHPKTAS